MSWISFDDLILVVYHNNYLPGVISLNRIEFPDETLELKNGSALFSILTVQHSCRNAREAVVSCVPWHGMMVLSEKQQQGAEGTGSKTLILPDIAQSDANSAHLIPYPVFLRLPASD